MPVTVLQEVICLSKPLPLRRLKLGVAPIVILGFSLIGLQALDGWLTYRGILKFGLEIEGNPLVLLAMKLYGVVGGLVLVKGSASILLFCVLSLARQIPWIPFALTGVGGTYLFAAVIPWITLLNIAG